MYEYELIHAGVAHDDDPPGRGSGRYGWGTGENPHQHQFDFLTSVASMRKDGLTDSEIAKTLLGQKGIDKNGEPIWANTSDLRAEISIQNTARNRKLYTRAAELYDKYGNISEVGRMMGRNESTIRSFLKRYAEGTTDKYQNTADMIRKVVDEKKLVDVGKGTELYLGCTDHTKSVALSILEREGYVKTWITIDQAGTDKKTTTIVLSPPGTEKRWMQENKLKVESITEFTPDNGKSWWTPEFPESIDSKRVMIRYAEEGGKDRDGTIEIRRGVEDVSLGGSNYAQVRIAVDGTNYMKGMAVYGDDADFPKGVDIIYNTNKKKGVPAIDKDAVYDPVSDTWSGKEVMKRLKIDQRTGEVDRDNPFGALIKSPKDKDGVIRAGGQRKYIGADGKEHLSPINKLQDEGDWDNWSRNLASQFLSKQPIKLIRQQIELSIMQKKAEFDEINSLTNPVIKKKLMEDFARDCDATAAELSVKGFRNQAFQVLLPVPSLKDNEIYAPNFDDGDIVALVRYPHGGVFEIPILTVNNKHQKAIRTIGKEPKDAVGINQNVAEQLSGADFDGDTALVIPVKSNNLNIKSSKPIRDLQTFDPKELYKLPDDAPWMTSKGKETEMGKVTNLINDMSVGGAPVNDIIKAVKHSMVVIDAQKHHLDYRRSEIDNDIRELKKIYQGVNEKGNPKGASTILSRASSMVKVDKFKEVTNTKIMTKEELERWNQGKTVLRPTGETKTVRITNPDKMTDEELEIYNSGKKVYRDSGKPKQVDVYQMDMVDDATELVRNKANEKEMAYAGYANDLKDIANQARRIARTTGTIKVSQSAKSIYRDEVESLKNKLRLAEMNAPKERKAQAIANHISSIKFESNPGMDFEHKQRERARALAEGRAIVGAGKDYVVIEPKEWDAIQAGAITTNMLTRILNNTDTDRFKQLATPRNVDKLSSAQESRIKAMLASGLYTQKEIANMLGISTSTVASYKSA